MVIERFKDGHPGPVGNRFELRGRMLPEGVAYRASWIDSTGTRCFQLMEAQQAELLNAWASAWSDLVEFEIVPVVTSADFWANQEIE